MLCHSMYIYTCCARCVCVYRCIGVWVYGCMHVCMYMPCVCHDCMWYNCKSSSRHANNKDKPSQTGEPACAGHPIIADRMPRTEGASGLGLQAPPRSPVPPSLGYFPHRPAATASGPCSICILTRRPSQKASTHHHRLSIHSSLASLAGSARQFSDRSSASPSSSPSPAPCLSSPIRPPRWRLQ